VPLFCKRLTDPILVMVCLLWGLGSPGCGWLADGALRELSLPPDRRWGVCVDTTPAHRAAGHLRFPPNGRADDPSGAPAVLARSGDAEGRSVWIRAVGSTEDDCSGPGYRWQYPDLEELLAQPPGQRPDWHRYLADNDPVVAANAAIALARSGDARGAKRLAEAVRRPDIHLPMRCAAVEALAGLEEPTVVPLLRELIEQYGRSTPESRPPYHADLHAELIRGLARHVDPADDPHFVTALHSRAPNVRLEALRAWAEGRGGDLPTEVADLRDDPDPNVRAAALQVLARRHHPAAYGYLDAALRDHDLRVRTAAIAALGELGGTQAQATLERMLEDQPEAVRAAAVSALSQLGAEEAVLGAIGDQSWRVRLKVAEALACPAIREGILMSSRRPGGASSMPHRREAARQLLRDPSAVVQRQVVLALAEWPLESAGPVLLEAMQSRSLMTRQAAAKELAARWPPAAEFPVEGRPERRLAVLGELQRRFREQFGLGHPAASPESAAEGPPAAVITPQMLDHVEQLVRRQDVEALVGFGPGLVGALEELVFDRQQALPEVIYRQVLPQYGPVFVALDRLECSDVSERRAAAGGLAELARQRPLGRLVVGRLAQLAVAEPDELVWQSVLTAVADDGSEPSVRLAYAAISHPSAEVRRRACDYLAAHPHPGHTKMLVPTLEDHSEAVARAAVRALGAAGRLDDTEPLRRLLGTTSEYLRLETAVALVRLGDPAGRAALERLAYSTDPKVRCRVAVVMGETAEPTFVPTLIRLLDDRPAVRRAALEGLPKTVGRDVSGSEDRLPASTLERVRRWKQWFDRRQGLATGSGLFGPT
jgi:HEAT repeat protein